MKIDPLPKALTASECALSNCSLTSSILVTTLIPRPPPPNAAYRHQEKMRIEDTAFNPQSTYRVPYIYRVQSCVSRLPKYRPPTPFSTQRVCPPPSECVLPPHQRRGGGGVHTTNTPGGEGSIFWKTRDIGFASYSIISLRFNVFQSRKYKQKLF